MKISKREAAFHLVRLTALMLAVLAIEGIFMPGRACADPNSDYLHGLDVGSIGYTDPGTALEVGGIVCDMFRRGIEDAKVSATLMAGAELDWNQAHVIIANATSYLCPDVPVA